MSGDGTAAPPRPDGAGWLPDSPGRGSTEISQQVIEKIAGRAASEVRGVDTAEPSALRRFTPFIDDGATDAEVGHERATVDLSIRVRYPEPVFQKADEVRTHVVQRVEELTGLHVTRVDVTVSQIAATRSGRRQRVI